MSAPAGVIRIALVVLLATAATGCGDSPTEPGAAGANVNVAGAWSGNWIYVVAGVTVTDPVTVTLSQTGANASGTWTAESGASGQLNFPATTTFSGNITLSQPTLVGLTCTGSASINGTASTNNLQFTLGGIASQGICQWGSSQRFELQR